VEKQTVLTFGVALCDWQATMLKKIRDKDRIKVKADKTKSEPGNQVSFHHAEENEQNNSDF